MLVVANRQTAQCTNCQEKFPIDSITAKEEEPA
jgi:hypothetical protein